MDNISLYYEHICEMETLMYRLANLLEFEQSDRGGWYSDYQLKEDLPKEKEDE